MPRSDIFDLNENDGTHLHKGFGPNQKRCYDLHCLHNHPCGDLCEGL